jgi:hypothetical protein
MASTLFFLLFFLSSFILTHPDTAAEPEATKKAFSSFPVPPALLFPKMAHGGNWTLDQMIYLVVMKMASKYGWKRVAEDFRTRFNSEATAKDCESKFNKDLKKSKIFRLVLQWLETAEFPEEDDLEGVCIVLDAVLLLSEIPLEDRRA